MHLFPEQFKDFAFLLLHTFCDEFPGEIFCWWLLCVDPFVYQCCTMVDASSLPAKTFLQLLWRHKQFVFCLEDVCVCHMRKLCGDLQKLLRLFTLNGVLYNVIPTILSYKAKTQLGTQFLYFCFCTPPKCILNETMNMWLKCCLWTLIQRV